MRWSCRLLPPDPAKQEFASPLAEVCAIALRGCPPKRFRLLGGHVDGEVHPLHAALLEPGTAGPGLALPTAHRSNIR